MPTHIPGPSQVPDYVYNLQASVDVSQAVHQYEVFKSGVATGNFVGFWGIIGRRERYLRELGPNICKSARRLML